MKKLCLLIAVIMVLGCVQGCAPENGAGTTITVVTPFDQKDGNYSNFVNACTAYETATGNTVQDDSSSSNEEWKSKIAAAFDDGNEPDVLFYFTGADADELVKSGKVASVDEIRKVYPDYASNMKGSMMPVSTATGRQYAIPVNGYWEGLFVNKKVLADCGVDIPGADYTWEQFIADCTVIRDKGYIPVACSLTEVPHYWFEYCVFNHGSVSVHASLPGSSGDAVGQNWVKGLQDMKDLYDKGFFPENTLTAEDRETNLLMTGNKAAFMIDGSWKVGWFRENAADINDFLVTYVPSRGDRKSTDIIGGISMGYYITKKAWNDPKKREACVEFVQAMTTDEVVSKFASVSASITALTNGATPVENADPLVVSALAMTKNYTGFVTAAQDLLTTAARESLFSDVSNIVTGKITPEEAVDTCLAIKK